MLRCASLVIIQARAYRHTPTVCLFRRRSLVFHVRVKQPGNVVRSVRRDKVEDRCLVTVRRGRSWTPGRVQPRRRTRGHKTEMLSATQNLGGRGSGEGEKVPFDGRDGTRRLAPFLTVRSAKCRRTISSISHKSDSKPGQWRGACDRLARLRRRHGDEHGEARIARRPARGTWGKRTGGHGRLP